MLRLLSISAVASCFMAAPLCAQEPGERFKISPPPAKVVEPSGVAVFDLTELLTVNPSAKTRIDAIAVHEAKPRRIGNYLIVEGPQSATDATTKQLYAIQNEALDTLKVEIVLCKLPENHPLAAHDQDWRMSEEAASKLLGLIDAEETALLARPTIVLRRFQEGEIAISDDTSTISCRIHSGFGEMVSIEMQSTTTSPDHILHETINCEGLSIPDGVTRGFVALPRGKGIDGGDMIVCPETRLLMLLSVTRTLDPPGQRAIEPILPTSVYTAVGKTRDGIGKAFLGREIAQVMGHLGAGWLERPEREQEERTDLLVGMLPLQEDSIIADIGAGSGYFTSRLSPLVPKGKVLATDIQPEMLEILARRVKNEGLTNVVTVLGKIDDTGLAPESVDLILLVDVYHEFDHPWEMLRSMWRALKPGGRVAIAEYRANDPTVPIKPLHTMTVEQVTLEFELAGFTLEDVKTDLPWQRLFLFAKITAPQEDVPSP